MKKIIALVLVLVLCLSVLAGCGSKIGDCAACGKTNVEVKTATYAGESADLCEDCYALFEALKDYL